jgi:hypothetical protein
VALAGLDRHAVGLRADEPGEVERGLDGRGLPEHLRAGHDPEDAAEHQVGDAVRFLAGEQVTEPGGVVLVSRGVEAMRVDEAADSTSRIVSDRVVLLRNLLRLGEQGVIEIDRRPHASKQMSTAS